MENGGSNPRCLQAVLERLRVAGAEVQGEDTRGAAGVIGADVGMRCLAQKVHDLLETSSVTGNGLSS